jgi:thioredoxin reductase/bacterioferritin-associated ferredoxin
VAQPAVQQAFDLIVLGAGPAGISAALSASQQGLRALIVDESPRPGGQVYRAVPDEFRVNAPDRLGEDFQRGEALRRALSESAVETRLDHRVWNVAPGFLVQAAGPQGMFQARARALVCATGASERIYPFPGWTLPGVIGLAGATVLLKSQQLLPGRRTLVCGVGPLLYAVAAGILKAGAEVAAVVDAASFGEWASCLPRMSNRPDLAARGAGWLWMLRKAGVPVLYRTKIVEARGADSVTEAVVAPVDALGRRQGGAHARSFPVDSVAVGHGLVPATEVSRLLGATQEFRADQGGWVAKHDTDGRTSLANFYVAGDGAGIAGAAAAEESGSRAGLAAARDLGHLDARQHATLMAEMRHRRRRAESFGGAMAEMMKARPGLADTASADVVVCRCEDVTRAALDTAIAAGARTLNELKSWTRCGMGPCQGRFCSETAAELIAAATGDRAGAGQLTARFPLRPVAAGQLVQGFDYEQEVPPPALIPM